MARSLHTAARILLGSSDMRGVIEVISEVANPSDFSIRFDHRFDRKPFVDLRPANPAAFEPKFDALLIGNDGFEIRPAYALKPGVSYLLQYVATQPDLHAPGMF